MKQSISANRKLQRLVLEVAELAQYLWQKGWAERNAGNISVNLAGILKKEDWNIKGYPVFPLPGDYPELAGCSYFVTGTGKRMRDLARNPIKNASIIRINEKGNAYQIFSLSKKQLVDFRPTSELPTHLGIHRMLKSKSSRHKAVIHTHPNELVALTHIEKYQDERKINELLWGMNPETIVFVPRGIGLVPYRLSGTTDIADETIEKLRTHDVVMWEKHGVFAVGENVSDAFDMIDILCKSADIFFKVRHAGYEPQGLTKKQLA